MAGLVMVHGPHTDLAWSLMLPTGYIALLPGVARLRSVELEPILSTMRDRNGVEQRVAIAEAQLEQDALHVEHVLAQMNEPQRKR